MAKQKSKQKTSTKSELSCFVIMPISDPEGYDKGHFDRVYKHLIKPACTKAGFKPILASDVRKTNYIMVDIIKKILDCDIALCDLSARNPNVLYELGMRQAFNKPVTLIKDSTTDRIFDVQGLRDTEYDASLRVDEVEKDVDKISDALRETYESKGEDNSLIQLLGIKAASMPSGVELSKETSLILNAVKDIGSRLSALEQGSKMPSWETTWQKPGTWNIRLLDDLLERKPLKTAVDLQDGRVHEGEEIYWNNDPHEFMGRDDKNVAIKDLRTGDVRVIKIDPKSWESLSKKPLKESE